MSRQLFRLRVYLCLASLLVFLTGIRQPLNAQVGMATLSGIVTDPSGAVIPNAEVTLERTSEHAARQTVTNSAGAYVIPSILPGTYRLSVKANGFESHAVDNIILSSGQGSTINVTLKVGAAKTTITVTQKSPLLETTTATVGTTVNSRTMTSLPLNGRNFTTLITTLPGTSPVNPPDSTNLSPAGTAINPSVYGQRQRDNQYTLDGVPNAEAIFNAIPMFPPPEAISEMKVQSGMDQGAYGWASGANINVVTKSGTNRYHGDAWEFLKNGALNARSYFSPSVGNYQWNQFGGAFGGPLVIPHVLSKDKAWYVFGYYEGLRDNTPGSPYLSFVPTAAELNGDFTGDPPIYNPYTTITGSNGQLVRQQFPGNIIPSGTSSLCAPQSTCINSAALTIAKGLYPAANDLQSGIPGVNYLGTSFSRNTYDQWSARVDHQFGQKDTFYARYSDARNPQTSVSNPNLPSITYARYTNIAAGDTHMFGPSLFLTARFGMQRNNWGSVTGGPDVATQAGTLAAFPPFSGQNVIPPLLIPGFPSLSQGISFYGPQYVFSGTADAQKILGHHTVGFGGGIYRMTFVTNNQTGTQVQFTSDQTSNFTPGTGYSLASYLLGLPESAGRVIGDTSGNMRGYVYDLYAQDSWRVNPKLTVNLGLRWDVAPTMLNLAGSGTFVWETGQYVWDVKNPITGQPANIRRGAIPTDWNNLQPRIGLAYELAPKTVLRAAYGIFYDTFGANYAQTQQGNRGNWPFAFPQTVASLNTDLPTAFLQNPFPGQAQGSTTPLGCQQCLEVDPSATRVPMIQEWSVSLQQQVTPSTKVELNYFGSHAIDLAGQIVDNTATTPGTGPYQDRQRWPQFPPYVNNGYNLFPSWYDGGDVSVTKQYSQNLSFLASYTWSKTLDYTDSLASFGYPFLSPTRFNLRDFKGPASFDVRNRIVASYVYDIPIHSQNKALNAVIGGWQHSGVFSVDSGLPYFVLLGSDNENIGTIPGRVNEFPNMLTNPEANFNPTVSEWFNTSAYQLPAFGTAGQAGKHALYSSGEVNWDADLAKKWLFGEGKDLEFRADFFNLPNASTFSYPGYSLGTSNFGKINGVRQGGRTIQFGLKLHF